jgi:hypothetical protein
MIMRVSTENAEENQRKREGTDQQQNIQLSTTTNRESEGKLRRDAIIKQMQTRTDNPRSTKSGQDKAIDGPPTDVQWGSIRIYTMEKNMARRREGFRRNRRGTTQSVEAVDSRKKTAT